MAELKRYKPVTPGQRFTLLVNKKELYSGRPEKSLVEYINRSNGRNNLGRITCRGKQRGNKKLYRKIDFKRNKFEVEGVVNRLEYDPNRTAFIALVFYRDGEKRYILATENMKKGDVITSSDSAELNEGNSLPLNKIPSGTKIHNIELTVGKGGQIVRSAGMFATVVGKDERYVIVKLPSGEYRKVLGICRATVGVVSNGAHFNQVLGKAGRRRWLGTRPITRGEVRNPVDHPLGGRTRGGRIPVSPWGWPTKGYKTRKNKRTDKYIVRKRK